MKTKRQEELVNNFLSALDDEIRPYYQDLILYLSELGYHPQKERSAILFKHDLHNKQMAKMSLKKNKMQTPYFALRFSACRGYSKKFTDIVSAAVINYPARAARCINNGCSFCRGEAASHVYTSTFSDGEIKTHCGAYVLEIPDITPVDIGEIKNLIKEEHTYLLKHEAGISA
ncbi:MAG: hypothetical protein ACYCWE_15510 [Eubacteriales bacterium]